MSADGERQLAIQIAGRCKHFTGIMNDSCKAGVEYRSVRDASQPGMYRWPCLLRRPATTTCELRILPTPEEAQAEAHKLEVGIELALANIASGICHVCQAKVEQRKQVGRCAYAMPCGHRIGQTGGDEDGP